MKWNTQKKTVYKREVEDKRGTCDKKQEGITVTNSSMWIIIMQLG